MNTNPDYLMLVGMISQMPEVDQAVIKNLANALKEVVESNPDLGVIAYSLYGLELQEQHG